MSGAWSIYMIRDGAGRLYTGISTDVGRRFASHQQGKGARSLRGRGPLELVWQQEVGDRSTALRLEYRLKQWSKSRKEFLLQDATQDDWGRLQAELKSAE